MVLISVQVAHDIRSPLAALGAAARGLDLPEDKRTLVDGSIARMQGIADDLLRRYRAPGAAAARPETCALAGLIEQVLAEKRIQHKDRADVKIDFQSNADGVKAAVDPKELQRIISNLVNNSVEAFSGPGTVAVRLAATDGKVLIEVKDDGKGIPAEILGRLGAKGETHGKAGGTGLGLYHARTSAESWGGSLRIESAPGKGTSVIMELPAAAKPAAGLRAVLLDDDLLVHMNWRMAAKAAGADLKAYKTAEEFAAAAGTLPRDIPVYIDSELGDGVKGEEIAKDLHERGFTDLTMATGHGAEKFANLPWLKVTGKEPPWA
ncbi:MAG: sensor histidine kinase [Elusimicrobiales bacterium]